MFVLYPAPSRYRHLVETLGDLSLAADIDPEGAALLLRESRVHGDLDSMLALLRAEERQNSRAEQSRSSGNGGVDDVGAGGAAAGADLLPAPCLEFLLEKRVVMLLCQLGATDRPAGTLALILGAMASLIGQVGAVSVDAASPSYAFAVHVETPLATRTRCRQR